MDPIRPFLANLGRFCLCVIFRASGVDWEVC